MAITLSKFRDVSEGLQAGQFSVGERTELASLDDLDPIYKQLLDEPVTCVIAVVGGDGRPNLTPMWFDYDGDKVLLNAAEHRRKTQWIRKFPHVTLMLMNPENPYHWMSIRATVSREIHEDDPADDYHPGEHVDRIWVKYTGNEPPYGLRDPSIDERRVLFVCDVERVATFGKP